MQITVTLTDGTVDTFTAQIVDDGTEGRIRYERQVEGGRWDLVRDFAVEDVASIEPGIMDPRKAEGSAD
jgi:hypothetical protein